MDFTYLHTFCEVARWGRSFRQAHRADLLACQRRGRGGCRPVSLPAKHAGIERFAASGVGDSQNQGHYLARRSSSNRYLWHYS